MKARAWRQLDQRPGHGVSGAIGLDIDACAHPLDDARAIDASTAADFDVQTTRGFGHVLAGPIEVARAT